MKVGMGVYPPEHVEEILDARDRQAAGQTALAKGLTLISLDYETELRPEITGENKEWKYRLRQEDIVTRQTAYLEIERCVDEDFERLLVRVVHQAVRNGALRVYVRETGAGGISQTQSQKAKEPTCRIIPGKAYGYYTFESCPDQEGWYVTASAPDWRKKMVPCNLNGIEI